jgi:hypothetical protein
MKTGAQPDVPYAGPVMYDARDPEEAEVGESGERSPKDQLAVDLARELKLEAGQVGRARKEEDARHRRPVDGLTRSKRRL